MRQAQILASDRRGFGYISSPLRSLGFGGHKPPVSLHGPAITFLHSKLHFGLLGLAVCGAHRLAFSNNYAE